MSHPAPFRFRGKCSVCPRECVGFGWYDPTKKHPSRYHFCCSFECANIIQRNKGKMNDPTPHEIGSMIDASVKGGLFLEGMGKTDLATFSEDEWMQFIEEVCTGFVDAMRTRAGMVMIPHTLGDGITG